MKKIGQMIKKYVTPTYFSNNVRYFAASFRLKTHSQYGVDIGLTKANTNVTHTGQYYITPPEEDITICMGLMTQRFHLDRLFM